MQFNDRVTLKTIMSSVYCHFLDVQTIQQTSENGNQISPALYLKLIELVIRHYWPLTEIEIVGQYV